MAIVMRIMLAINSIIIGLGQGFQPVCGYNYGAGLFARVKEGYWFCVRLATCVLVVLAVLLWVFAPQLVEIFRSDPAVVAVGVAGVVGLLLSHWAQPFVLRVVDFALCAMDELANQAAKNRYMFGGQGRVPLVVRMPVGIWDASAAQHSQSLEAWFAHLPGLVVLCPGTPQDNHALLRAALDCGDPMVYLEHKTLWGERGRVDASQRVEIGRAALRDPYWPLRAAAKLGVPVSKAPYQPQYIRGAFPED